MSWWTSEEDLKNNEEESGVEREVDKGEDPVLPLKRGLDQLFDKEIKQEMGDGEEMVKPDSKKSKNIVKGQNLEESITVLFPKKEPNDKYGELEQTPGSSFGVVSLKNEPKEENSEFGEDAGTCGVSFDVCKKETKVELEEGEIEEANDENGETKAGMGKQEMQGVSFLKREVKEEYSEVGKENVEEGEIPGASFGAVSVKREPKEEYSELEAEAGRLQFSDVCKKEPTDELEEGEIFEKAKQLKHRADKAECITTKVQSYLSSIRLFIKSYLVTNNKDGSPISKDGNSSKVLRQTQNLTKLVYKLCGGKGISEELAKHLSICAVLVLRAQSLIESHLPSPSQPVPQSDPTWKLADQLVSQSDDINDLFANLDKECGSLTQQSSLGQLVGYLEMALQKLPKSP